MANASSRRLRPVLAAGLLVVGLGAATDRLVGQQPQPQPLQALPPAAAPTPPADPAKPVAYIYGNEAVTHEEFGKYLMDRGGADKLDLFVNKKIIEREAAKRNVAVTDLEMKAALEEDMASVSAGGAVSRDEFIKIVLAKHGKTLFEWMEDVVRPRLLLRKMCYDRVKVTEKDLTMQFERRYGEQRAVQIILYPKGDPLKVIQDQWGKIRNDPVEFDSAARAQANPALAAALGKIKPITRHLVAEDKIVEDTAFKLKKGEVSEVLQTQQGWLVMKLLEVIPPNTAANYETEKPRLQKAAYDELLEQEIPKFFGELRKAANVQTLYTPPTEWRSLGSTGKVPSVIPSGPAGVQQAGAQQPAGK